MKRVVIVDFNHMAHRYFHSPFSLSVRLNVNGVMVERDTRIQSGTIKSIYRWSNQGNNPTAVCFDRPCPARKEWLSSHFSDMEKGTSGEYKGNRSRMADMMFQGISDTEHILRASGVSCYAKEGYEADDLVYACVKRAKEKYPDLPIDVITNDADLLPLVDSSVSVFLRSKKGTYAVDKSIEKDNYIQVTPDNYSEVVGNLSDFKDFYIPYNSILLHKLLRGDSSDNYKRKDISRMFPKTKWNSMMTEMVNVGVNFEEVFRYGDPVVKILYKGTDKVFEGTMAEAMKSPDRSQLYQKICNTEQLDCIMYLLDKFTALTPEQLEHLEALYWGINLNQIYPNATRELSRVAFQVNENNDITEYDRNKLYHELMPFQINLPMY